MDTPLQTFLVTHTRRPGILHLADIVDQLDRFIHPLPLAEDG